MKSQDKKAVLDVCLCKTGCKINRRTCKKSYVLCNLKCHSTSNFENK